MRLAKLCAAAVLAAGVSAAVAQPPGGGRGQGGGQGGVMLLRSKTVQEALKLSDDQKGKVKAYLDKQRELMSSFGPNTDRDEMREKFTALQAEGKKLMTEVMKEEQAKRLKQIEVQVAGPRAFMMPEVQDGLKLTDEQKDKLKDAGQAYQKEANELREELGLPTFGGRPGAGGGAGRGKVDPAKEAEFAKKDATLQKEFMAKVDGMLTADQKTAWKGLTGEAVDVAKVREETRPQMMRPRKDD